MDGSNLGTVPDPVHSRRLVSLLQIIQPLDIVREITPPAFSHVSILERGPSPVYFRHILTPNYDARTSKIRYISMDVLDIKHNVIAEQMEIDSVEDMDIDLVTGDAQPFVAMEDLNPLSSSADMKLQSLESTEVEMAPESRTIELTGFKDTVTNTYSCTTELASRVSKTMSTPRSSTYCGRTFRTQGEKSTYVYQVQQRFNSTLCSQHDYRHHIKRFNCDTCSRAFGL
jgi:hypothetical protein